MTRVALVGLGDIGLNAHLPALLRNADVEVFAVADPIAAHRARAAGQLPGVASYENLDGVLADKTIEAVVLATPPWVTTSLAVQALRAGRYVLAEKPIATSVAAAGPIGELPVGDRARLQVGLTYRHDPAMELLRSWIVSGRLGERLFCRAQIYDEQRDPADPAHAERILGDLRHGSPVLHEGSHVFDWLSYLFGGPPVSVDDAWALRTDPAAAVPNLNGARLTYPGGTVAVAEFGWWTDRLPPCEVSILGDRGYAVLDGSTFALTLQTVDGVETVEFPGRRMVRCFDRQLARFVELIRGQIDRAVPGFDEGLASLRVSEQVARGGTADALG
ncbi:MAG TPA: Gfo/Idh/MocA family oxidoreductase [Mycobacteriales bacterium]|nr:Gfo/Idh/MocA family oxidoreductase [Mycobacteriales bacterium]